MSVSDPLLKQLKGYILEFHRNGIQNDITDSNIHLQPFCETLELILRKGIKQSTSIFGSTKRDYWNWVEHVTERKNNNYGRLSPGLCMAVDAVKKCRKIYLTQGRGRQFIRLALMRKVLMPAIELLIGDISLLESWYEPDSSILGNEILCEILMSLLLQLSGLSFSLNTKNATFLDETWIIPTLEEFQLVPCIDIGIQIQFIDGCPVVTQIEPGSVAEDDGHLEVGDVVDEVLSTATHHIRIGVLSKMLKQNQGCPIHMAVIKCKLPDESVFPPIVQLLQKEGKDYASLQRVLNEDEKRTKNRRRKPPPHAQLPEDAFEEVPVHNAEDRAVYRVKYLGKVEVGMDGGVHQIEGAVNKALELFKPEPDGRNLQDVVFELGETGVIVTGQKSNEVLLKHSYPEISSCGRKVDEVLYFSYIAGETTCTLAQQFVAYLFMAKTDEECKTVLCSIAQGFDRTHWFV